MGTGEEHKLWVRGGAVMSIWADASGWPVPPTILIGCLVAEILYFRGWGILVKHAQAKQAMGTTASSVFAGAYQRKSWFWRGIFFMASILMLLLASCAPVDILASRLFWVHMIQHLLLLVVIAPLFVAAAPFLPIWLGLPRQARTLLKATVKLKIRRACYQLGYWLRQPAITCALLILGTWVWHWPPLYDLALTNDIIHDWCEHATFLAVSVLFWTQVIPSPPLHPHMGYLGRMGCVGVAIVQNLVLAVLLAFAPLPLYAPYAHLVLGPGQFSALQDQQFGAGIMWTFGDVPFGIAFSILVQQWLASQPDVTTSEVP
jgi:putative membrane protein